MSISPRTRALALSGGALTVLLGASLVAGAAGAASAAPAKPVIVCPQATSVTGFPIAPTPFVTPVPGVTMTPSVTGTLPAGLTFREYVFGTPSTVQTTTFTVSVTATAADGSSSSDAKDCTMTVKAAPVVSRIAGANRYEQSVKASQAKYDEASVVYLASGENYADALSASAIAAEHDAPLLLTPKEITPAGVLAEIDRLDPEHVVIVGGRAAVSDGVITQLDEVVDVAGVVRVGGADRYEVSRNLITHPEFGVTESDEVYIATGANFPDALSAGPAAAHVNAPVLLVYGPEAALTVAEKTVLTGLSATKAHIVGGTGSVSAALQTDLAKSFATDRSDGDDRYETSMAVVRQAFGAASTVYLASGTAFPDALSGGALAGANDAPLAITQSSCVSRAAAITIGRLAPSSVVVLGGTAALGPDVERLVKCPLDD